MDYHVKRPPNKYGMTLPPGLQGSAQIIYTSYRFGTENAAGNSSSAAAEETARNTKKKIFLLSKCFLLNVLPSREEQWMGTVPPHQRTANENML